MEAKGCTGTNVGMFLAARLEEIGVKHYFAVPVSVISQQLSLFSAPGLLGRLQFGTSGSNPQKQEPQND